MQIVSLMIRCYFCLWNWYQVWY